MTTAGKNINAESIIENVRFSFNVSENQEDTFTKSHTRYKCRITYGGRKFTFHYQCNPKYNAPNKKDCLYAILSDAECYECARDVDDFLTDRGEKAYKACGRTAAALNRIFTNDEREALSEYFSEY